MKIVDKEGKWFVNTSQFPMVDGENGTRFESGEPTKATETNWVKAQAVLNPFTPEPGDDPSEVKAQGDNKAPAKDAEKTKA